jgi:hypothetical protein
MQMILALLLFIDINTAMVFAADAKQKRPRDYHEKLAPIDETTTKRLIASVEYFKTVLEMGDNLRFYHDCFDHHAKENLPEAEFMKEIALMAPKLKQLFSDILDAYKKGMHLKDDFQIGRLISPDPTTKQTFMIRFADRIDDTGAKQWPEGRPYRVKVTPDGDSFRLNNID